MNTLLKFSALLLTIIAMLKLDIAQGNIDSSSSSSSRSLDDASPDIWSSDEESPSIDDHSSDSHDWSSDDVGGVHCRDPDDFFNRDTYWTNLTSCGPEFACRLGADDDDDRRYNNKVGTFICRTTFHPITGEPFERVRCIPIDRAWETDVCGCCGGNCPNVTDSKASCLDKVSAKEEDNVIQFALGTSDRTSSSSSFQLSSDGSSSMENGILSVVVTFGLGAIVLMLA
ncbi:hypothetical protein IV203_007700 [Nitzschia inconspicua]|uniref:Uncharacterized protein n=1 Tax=Nitzschia inconspicua TaxID=303405 RepID=A0A9K3KY85_9STRA|nr:hypothetical protein IV203_007700 [Nitzschia inconspicua]